MKRRPALAWTAGGLVLVALTALAVVFAEETAGPSVLSSGSEGWLAARRYLEARGVETVVRDRPLAAGESSGEEPEEVWVTTFPWQQASLEGRLEPIRDFVRRGGTLILGTSGGLEGQKEYVLLNLLGAPLQAVGPEPPLNPLAWWRFRSRTWALVPEGGEESPLPIQRPARVTAGSALPQPPPEARILRRLRDEEGEPAAAMTFPLGRGRVVLLPSEALSNGRLGEPGNADLLETLLTLAPAGRWTFDEFAHGLEPPAEERTLEAPGAAFDLFVGHLGLIYLLALVAWGRRFGPPWREPPVQAGSAAGFLRGLGSLHHRFGHHQRAAELLLERTRALHPRRQIPREAAELAGRGDAKSFLRLARSLAGAAHGPHPRNRKEDHDG